MARTPGYRRSDGEAAVRPPVFRRAWLPALLALTVLVVAWFVVGTDAMGPLVLTWLQGALVATIVLPAAAVGLAMTAPLARAGVFPSDEGLGWPDGFRLLLSIALGLGAVALGVLLLGSFQALSTASVVVLLALLALAGAWPTLVFVRQVDRGRLTLPLRRTDALLFLAAVPVAVLLIAAAFHPGLLWESEGRGYDVLSYHLQLPREYLAAGSTAPLTHNVYSFLPGLIEMLYTALMALARVQPGESPMDALYPASLLHAFITLLPAGVLLTAPLKLSHAGRIMGALLILSTPWTLVIGSLAYNDGGVLLYGSLALTLALAQRERHAAFAQALAVGALVGLAVGVKLTAGLMVATPLGVMLLTQRRWRDVALVTGVALLVFAPWPIRAAVPTANPIFPIAADTLGRGHWSPAQAQRWAAGHAARPDQAGAGGRLRALADESVLHAQWSPGVASVQRWIEERPRAPHAVVPVWKQIGFLWPILLAATVLAISRGPLAWSLVIFGVVQILAWVLFTHLQSRFLLPLVLPLALLVAVAAEVAATARVVLGTALGLQAMLTPFYLLTDLRPFGETRQDQMALAGLAGIAPELLRLPDRLLPTPADPAAPLPRLDDDIGVLLVGTATPLYYHGRVQYHTVFDRNAFAEELAARTPGGMIDYLLQQGIDYIVVDYGEIDRLRRTYGYAENVTRESIARLEAAGLRPVGGGDGRKVLYAVVPPATRVESPATNQ